MAAAVNDETAISRVSFLVAGILGLVGLGRLGGDYLTDRSPSWTDALRNSWVRYVVRTGSDGSFFADVNVQFFKVLAVPCGVSVMFYLHLILAGGIREADRTWHTRRARVLYIGALLFLCTVIEVEKATHFLGMGFAGILSGEAAWKNHLVHLASAALGWLLMRRLRYRSRATIASSLEGATRRPLRS